MLKMILITVVRMMLDDNEAQRLNYLECLFFLLCLLMLSFLVLTLAFTLEDLSSNCFTLSTLFSRWWVAVCLSVWGSAMTGTRCLCNCALIVWKLKRLSLNKFNAWAASVQYKIDTKTETETNTQRRRDEAGRCGRGEMRRGEMRWNEVEMKMGIGIDMGWVVRYAVCNWWMSRSTDDGVFPEKQCSSSCSGNNCSAGEYGQSQKHTVRTAQQLN